MKKLKMTENNYLKSKEQLIRDTLLPYAGPRLTVERIFFALQSVVSSHEGLAAGALFMFNQHDPQLFEQIEKDLTEFFSPIIIFLELNETKLKSELRNPKVDEELLDELLSISTLSSNKVLSNSNVALSDKDKMIRTKLLEAILGTFFLILELPIEPEEN